MRRIFCLVIFLQTVLLAVPSRGYAQDVPGGDTALREIVLSSTYGVMAGTLVGAASLAFTTQPGENLQRIARGASIGLYVGILLGLYVAYIVPGQMDEQNLDGEIPVDSRWQLFPIISAENKLDGFAGEMTVITF